MLRSVRVQREENDREKGERKKKRGQKGEQREIGARACGERDDWLPKAAERQTLASVLQVCRSDQIKLAARLTFCARRKISADEITGPLGERAPSPKQEKGTIALLHQRDSDLGFELISCGLKSILENRFIEFNY